MEALFRPSQQKDHRKPAAPLMLQLLPEPVKGRRKLHGQMYSSHIVHRWVLAELWWRSNNILSTAERPDRVDATAFIFQKWTCYFRMKIIHRHLQDRSHVRHPILLD